MDKSSVKISDHKNMADIIDNMAVETYEMEESAFNMFDKIVQVKRENGSAIRSPETSTSSDVDEVKMEDTPFEMVDINNMVEFENEEATHEMEVASDPISDSGKMVEVTFQVAPMTHRISEPSVDKVEAKEKCRITTVSSLKKIPFYDLPLESRIAIKRLGRPTPALNIVHHLRDSTNGNHKRTYQLVIYDKNSWICGCETTNKLFCFPCLLLSKRDNPQYNNWVDSGISDLQNLGLKMNEHEASRLHLVAVALLEQIDVAQPLAGKMKKKSPANMEGTIIKKPKDFKNVLPLDETNLEIRSFTVPSVKVLTFTKLPIEQQLHIKRVGRPTPDLNLFVSKSDNRSIIRTSHKDVYSKWPWICGCEITNKLYCFPCLLFSNEDPIWTKKGFSDISRLHMNTNLHECSQLHLTSMLQLHLLGKANINKQLNGSYQESVDEHKNSITRHNEIIARNRSLLSKVIDCMKMSSLLAPTHSDTGTDSNSEVFRDLMLFSCELDASFKREIEEKSFLFKDLSKEFQNCLLDCMLLVCQENIRREISLSNYVSVIVEETASVSSSCKLSIIFRYVLPNGKPIERFLAFVEPDVGLLCKVLIDLINSMLQNQNKLVSQSYDGSSIIGGHLNEIQTIIQQHYKYAFYVHCYAHDLNQVIEQATIQKQQVRIFFSNLKEVVDFLCSPQFSAALSEILAKNKSASNDISFVSMISNIKFRPIDTVYRYGKDLIAAIEDIETSSKHSATISKSGHVRRVLNDQEFIFWIKIFYSLMPHVENFKMVFQHEYTDKNKIKLSIDCFLNAVNKNEKRGCNNEESVGETISSNENNMAKEEIEVCQITCREIVKRFSFLTPLSMESLFDSKRFMEYRKDLPIGLLEEIIHCYPFFNNAWLRAELKLIYDRQDFIELKGVVPLMVFLIQNDLQSMFPETYKLLSLILTIPMTTKEVQRCFDTRMRIGNFLQSPRSFGEMNNAPLAMLSIERNMIRNMPNFNEQVIEMLSTKSEWASNFSFKKFGQ